MKRFFLYLISIIFFLIIFLLAVLSTIGIETNKFNKLISEKVLVGRNVNLKLLTVKFKLDPKELSLFLETRDPKVNYKDLSIPVQNVKVYVDFLSLLKTDLIIKKINISLKELDITQLYKLSKIIKPSTFKSFINNKIQEGKLISEIEIFYNKKGLLKEFIAKGYVKNLKAKLTKDLNLTKTNFNFFADIKNSDKIIIMLPGATNRKKGAVDYQRYSWSSSFEQSFITFSDPTITAENDLSIGWFQNKLGSYGVGLLTILVRRIIAILGVSENDILFFGSSAGAFVSLKLANEFTVSPVVAINPQIYLYNYSKAHYNLGITYQEMGKVEKAIDSFRQAIIHEPDFTEAHNSLGFSYLELGKFNEAQKHIRSAISINPRNAIAYYNLGVILQEIGKSSDTLECYKQAIKLDPKFSNAYLNLFNFYEKTNELEKALSVIENAKGKVIEKKADFLFYEALIHFRKEEYGIAEKLIKKINKDEISINRKTNFLKLKSNLYHHKKQFHQAFESYKAMNDSIISSNDYDIDAAELYYKQQSEKVFELKQLIKQSPYGIKATANWFQPTFLIGFPRSGTTLLDSILRSHSKINVVEEQPIVQKMKSQIELGDFSKIEKIEKIRSSNTEKLSRIYLKELEKYYKLNTNGILIDKLPLNILELPLIIGNPRNTKKYIFRLRFWVFKHLPRKLTYY